MKWKCDNSNLNTVAKILLGEKGRIVPKCCGNPDIHVYAWRHDKKGGRRNSAWVWCSNCRAYSHIDGIYLHDDWKDCEAIDKKKLTAIPIYQEEQKGIIDKHVAVFMKTEGL